MSDVQMPEPVAWMLAMQTMGGDIGWKLSWTQSGAGVCNRLSGESHEKPLITTTQAQAYADARVREALEIMAAEAHQACINYCNGHATNFEDELKQAIRALIPTPPTEKP